MQTETFDLNKTDLCSTKLTLQRMPSEVFNKGQKEANLLLAVLTPKGRSFQEEIHINMQAYV